MHICMASGLIVYAPVVFKLFGWPLKKIINTKILFASMKTFKNSETCTESRLKFFSWLTISVIGQFSPAITSHWTAEKSA
jgi:hypothetical protein